MRSLHSRFGRWTPARVLTIGTLLLAFGCDAGSSGPGVVEAPKASAESAATGKAGPPPKRTSKAAGQKPVGPE